MDYRLRMIDWTSKRDKEDVTRLFADYTAESWEAGGSGDGYAVASWLQTVLASVDGETVAVYSYDCRGAEGEAPAIEMIYVDPAYRRQRIASAMVRELKSRVPDIHLKSPLTPACAAMAKALGVPATVLSNRQIAALEKGTRQIRAARATYCSQQGHRRTVAFQACPRCMQAFPRLTAHTWVDKIFTEMDAATQGLTWDNVQETYDRLSPEQREQMVRSMMNNALNMAVVLGRHDGEGPPTGRS